MDLFWKQTAENIMLRFTGPLHFRMVLQPIMAILLGIRDGKKDAKLGNSPIISDIIFFPEHRKRDLKSAWKALTKPLILAVVLDAVAQYLIFKQVLVIPALIVGVTLMGVPYLLARGITNRILSRKKMS